VGQLNKLDWQRNVVVGMQVILPTAQVVTVTKDSLTINPDGEKQEISSGLWYAIEAYLERKTRAKARDTINALDRILNEQHNRLEL